MINHENENLNPQVRKKKSRAATWQNQQYDTCAQQRLGSAWASTQSDQSLCCPHTKRWDLGYPLSALRRLWSDWADAQADLSLRWAHMPFCCFCHEVAHMATNWPCTGGTVSPCLHTKLELDVMSGFGRVASISRKDPFFTLHGSYIIKGTYYTLIGLLTYLKREKYNIWVNL